jgi:hypothetical protein
MIRRKKKQIFRLKKEGGICFFSVLSCFWEQGKDAKNSRKTAKKD